MLLHSPGTCGNGGNSMGAGGVVQGAGWSGSGSRDLAGVMQLLNIQKECKQTLLIQ